MANVLNQKMSLPTSPTPKINPDLPKWVYSNVFIDISPRSLPKVSNLILNNAFDCREPRHPQGNAKFTDSALRNNPTAKRVFKTLVVLAKVVLVIWISGLDHCSIPWPTIEHSHVQRTIDVPKQSVAQKKHLRTSSIPKKYLEPKSVHLSLQCFFKEGETQMMHNYHRRAAHPD